VAPILQCPDCDTKHPLNEVPESGTFPCKGCGRVLKVPQAVPGRAKAPAGAPAAAGPAAAAASSPPPAPAPNPTVASRPVDVREPTRVMPVVTRNAPPSDARAPATEPAPATARAKVPWWMQLLLWIVAVPLGFLIVFLFARASGLFSSNQLSDVFLANGFGRFWPLARLLPIVALVTAALVQAGVVLLSRRKGRTGAATATRARR
jgi:hypothetical protein